jgi:ribose transport system ATP-binding protein
MPSVVVAAVVVALGLYTQASNSFFLSQYNLVNLLLLASALAFVALGQLIVLLVGGIDLSVGPLTGLSVVLFSFFASTGKGDGMLALGVVVVLGAALVVGLANGVMVRVVRLAPVVATLATYIVLQGISLLARPQPSGYLRYDVTAAIKTAVGPIPVAFIVAVVLACGCELLLRRSRAGIELRAVGSSEVRAHRLGARSHRVHLVAYVLCALFSALGGLMLASQVGIGDPSVGVNYTLTSIAAVVLGGASIFGGRGSFIGALLGALLIQEITSATTFLKLTVAWQYWLPGILILAGAAAYSRVRALRIGVGMPAAGGASRAGASPLT